MTAHERIVGLYEENAAASDRQRGRDLHEKPWLDCMLALIPAGGSILDLGWGTGEPVARYLIERGHAVTGVDSSPAPIAMAPERPSLSNRYGKMTSKWFKVAGLQNAKRFGGF